MDATKKRPSRRSHPNLRLLSVTPLTPNYPLPATEDDDNSNTAPDRNSRPTTPKSYLEPRSMPQTPSILSRSSSRSRLHRAAQSSVTIPDLDSASEKLQGETLSPQISRSSHGRSHSARAPRGPDHTGWILHTATTLTSSTAESKGQAWLATRTSSTSLADGGGNLIERIETYAADDEFSPVSYRHGSRPQSRFGSRVNSRRGSRVGIMTPMGVRTPGGREDEAQSYFDNVSVDFVDGDEEEYDDDGEMKRLVWGRVGGWVDWAVGWMDFRADEAEQSEEEKQEGEEETNQAEQSKDNRKGKGPAKPRKPKRQKQIHYESTENISQIPPAPESDGVLGDAAWLFGLARSALA